VSHLWTVALGIKFFTNATANERPVPDLELCGTRRDWVIAEAEANDCGQQRRLASYLDRWEVLASM
jgi:hypothetical protein